MASVQKSVEIIFGGKNEVSKTIGAIEKDFVAFEKSVDKAVKPLADMTGKVLQLDAALAAMVVGGLALAVKAAGDFDESFDKLGQRITASAGDIEKFKGDVMTYASSSTRSLTDINAALAESVQRGVSYKDSLDRLATAEQLAVATHSDLKSSTVLLTTVMNSYGASASEAAHYGDVFTQAVKSGAGEIPQLADEMGKISGIAKGMGIPIETLTSALSALGAYGVDTGTALGGLKFMLSNLLDPSKEAREAAQKLGISFDATAVKTKGLEVIMKQAFEATGGNAEAMKVLFGSVRGLNVAFDLAGDSQGKFRDALEKSRNSTGVMKVEYEKFVNDFGNLNQRLENSFKLTLITIGDKLMPEYGKIAGALGDLMKGIKVGLDKGAFDPLFAELDKVGGGISKWLADVGKAFPDALKQVDFGGLAKAFNEFGKAFVEAFSLDKVNPKQLADSMQLVVDSVTSLIDVTKGIGEVFAPFLNTIKEAIKAFNSLDSDTKTLIGNVLGLSLAFKMFGPVGLILVGLGTDAETMAKVFAVSFGTIENGINTLKIGVLSLAMVFASASEDMAVFLSKVALTDERKAAAAEDLKRTGERVKIIGGLLEQAWTDAAASSTKVVDAFNSTGEATVKATSHADNYAKALGTIPPKVAAITTEIEKLPDKKEITVLVEADGTTIEKAYGIIKKTFPDGQVLYTNVGVQTDGANLDSVKDKIKDAAPDKKTVDIEVKLDTEKIKAQSDIIGKSIEWKAKVDIAQVEGAFKIMEVLVANLGKAMESTGVTLVGMANAVTQNKGWDSSILASFKAEEGRRVDTFAQQKLLTDVQIKYMNAKIEMMKPGNAIVTIDGKGLQPELEAFMFTILKAIQVKANAEGAAFLTGI